MKPLLLALALAVPALGQPAVEAPLDRALRAVVRSDGTVDYAALAARHRADPGSSPGQALDAALTAVAAQDPAALGTDAERTAFLVNAYNAHVLAAIADRPRARHIEREGLFGALFRSPVRVAGLSMTLDQLEHGVLRRQDRVNGAAVPAALRALRPRAVDMRIHAALHCAAASCPPLAPRAFRAATLDADLERRWRAFVGSDRAVRAEGRRLVLSSIFDWFAADVEAEGPLGDVLLAAMPASRAVRVRGRLAGRSVSALRADRRVTFAYDWTVNRSR